jgi:hypothetical protein
MKTILLLCSVVLLLGTTGCVVADDRGRRHDHDRDYGHADAIVAPAVVVRPPVVIVQ